MYSIKVLSNEEFEKLPYSRVATALGVADPKTNTAYVRYSAYPELNKYLIDHEFDHFVEEIPTDEFEGVRYKDFGNMLGGLGNIAQKAGPVVSLFNPGVGTAITGAGALASQFQKRPISPGKPGYGQLDPNQLAVQNSRNQPSAFSNALNLFQTPQALLGSGFLGTGLNKNMPKVPDLPQSVESLRGSVQSGGGPMAQLGKEKLTGLLNQNFQPLEQPEIDAALRQLEKDQLTSEDQVRDLYRNLRPGTDPSTDAAFRRDLQEVNDQFSRAKADTLATRTRDTKSQFDQQRLMQIQHSLGADDRQMEQLFKLAQLDVEQIMAQLQIDYASAQAFKETFIGLGSQLFLQGAGVNPLFAFGRA